MLHKYFRTRRLAVSTYAGWSRHTGSLSESISFRIQFSQNGIYINSLKAMYEKRFDEIKEFEGTYWIVVIEDTVKQKIVTTGTLILEKKFTHFCGAVRSYTSSQLHVTSVPNTVTPLFYQVGHIEDIVVDNDYRGQQLGKLYAANSKI